MADSPVLQSGRRKAWVIRCVGVLAPLAAVVALWLWLPAQPLISITPPEDAIPWSFSPDSGTLVTQARRGYEVVPPCRFWDVRTGRELPAPFPDSASSSYAWFLPCGTLLADRRYEEDRDRTTLKLWHVATGQEWASYANIFPAYRFSPGGRLLAFAADSGGQRHIQVWDVLARQHLASVKDIHPVAISPDEKTVVTDDYPVEVPTLNKQPGRQEPHPSGPPLWPGGEFGHLPSHLTFWDLESGQQRFRHPVPKDSSFRLVFSSDGSTFVLSAGTKPHKLRDTASGQERADLGSTSIATYVLDGGLLAGTATRHTGGCIMLWDTRAGALRNALPIKPALGEFNSIFLCASADGRTLAMKEESGIYAKSAPTWLPRWSWLARLWPQKGQWTRQIHLFDVATASTLGTIPGSPDERLLLSPDGKLLAQTSQDRKAIEVWEVPPRRPVTTLVLLSIVLGALAATALRRQCSSVIPSASKEQTTGTKNDEGGQA